MTFPKVRWTSGVVKDRSGRIEERWSIAKKKLPNSKHTDLVAVVEIYFRRGVYIGKFK